MKKISAILLALIMMLSMVAFAADDGTITIQNSDTTKTYDVYKVFDATFAGENVSYTYTKTGDTDALYAALTGEGSPFELTATTTANVYNVSSDATAATISAWLTENVSKLTKTTSKAGNGTALVFENLAYGYYYISTNTGSVVAINSAVKDVVVVDKTETVNPDMVKKIVVTADDPATTETNEEVLADENTANITDTVNYKVTGTLSRYDNQTKITSYTFTDTMEAGLTRNEDVVVVIGGETLTAGEDYTITYNATGFVINLPTVDANGAFIYDVDEAYVITYSAVVNDNAEIAGNGNTNTMNLKYNTSVQVAEDTVVTKTFAFILKKVNAKGEPLANATFQLPFYVEASGSEYIYAGTTAADGLVNTVTTPESGIITIKGVKDGSYSITETAAPAGYNILTGAVTVTVNASSETTTAHTTYLNAAGAVVAESVEGGATVTVESDALHADVKVIVNLTGEQLPSTGGIGTTIFYTVGGLMMAAAIVLLVAKKKVAASK